MPKECEKAARILQSFLADPEHPDSALNSIPKAVLQQAKGLAIFSVVKAGFVWSGKAGSGVVVARLDDGSWSAPSCIATGGVGFGLQVSMIGDIIHLQCRQNLTSSFMYRLELIYLNLWLYSIQKTQYDHFVWQAI